MADMHALEASIPIAAMTAIASTFTRSARLALLTVLAASCVASQAQMGGGMGGMRRGGGGGDSSMRRGSENKDDGPTLNDRLFELRMRLLIDAPQTPAWDRFQADVLAVARPKPQAVSVAEENSAVQAMQRELTRAQNRYTLTENLAGSFNALYAQLQPQQKEVADQLVPKLLPYVLQPAGGAGAGRSSSLSDSRP